MITVPLMLTIHIIWKIMIKPFGYYNHRKFNSTLYNYFNVICTSETIAVLFVAM